MSGPLDDQECGCIGGGGRRLASTCRGAKNMVAEAETVLELELEPDSDLNVDPGREEESSVANGSSGAEWSGAEE